MKLSCAVEWVVVILGGAVVVACSGGVSAPPAGGGGGGSGGSTSSTLSSTSSSSGAAGCDQGLLCADCVECARGGPCASQSEACAMNPDCILMEACDADCGGNNPPCEALCEAAHAEGVPSFKALKGCTTSACPMSCGAGGL